MPTAEVDYDVDVIDAVLGSAQALIDNVGRVILGKEDQVRIVVAALLIVFSNRCS